MEVELSRAFFAVFMRYVIGFGMLCAIIVFLKSEDTGDDPWVWMPFFIFLPFIALPVYIGYRIKNRREDRLWEKEQLKADQGSGGHVSRRVSSEKDLVERYNRGKGRRT